MTESQQYAQDIAVKSSEKLTPQPEFTVNFVEKDKQVAINVDDNLVPEYMKDVYQWAYVSDTNANLLDNPFTVSALLFLQDKRLLNNYLEHIDAGSKMIMMAHVYGPLVTKVAQKVGKDGSFHLADVTPIQVIHAKKKLNNLPWCRVWQEDAATAGVGDYDVCGSFFLLHEVPDDKKSDIINNMLSKVKVGGKVIMVDYHKPKWWQPIGYILKFVNSKLEPFAKAIWDNEIVDFADKALVENFKWEKKTIFGGVYQRVIATRLK